MRLLNYLSFSGLDENTNKFRALNIKLVDEHASYTEIINEMVSKYDLKNVDKIILSLNKDLKSIYKGKYFFDFCIDEGSNIDKLKLGKKAYQKIKILQLEANNQLNILKKDIENILQQSKS